MSRTVQAARTSTLPLDPAQSAEIHSAEIRSLQPAPATLKPREALNPEEEALSLPQPEAADPKITLLNQVLGAHLTTDNPLWRGDPVPTLRGLQKALIAHSLTLSQDARRPSLDALTVVERAILLRLRWQQMRRSAMEPPVEATATATEERHATQQTA